MHDVQVLSCGLSYTLPSSRESLPCPAPPTVFQAFLDPIQWEAEGTGDSTGSAEVKLQKAVTLGKSLYLLGQPQSPCLVIGNIQTA